MSQSVADDVSIIQKRLPPFQNPTFAHEISAACSGLALLPLTALRAARSIAAFSRPDTGPAQMGVAA